MAWAVGSVVGVPLGALADRRGPRGTAVLLALVTGIAVASFLFIRSFVPFLVVVCLYATAQCGLAAARQALLAGLVDRSARTGVLAHLQSTLNAGLALGAALGGLALQYDTQEAYLAVFVLDTVGFLSCTAVLLLLPAVAPVPGRTGGEPRFAVLRDRPYAVLTFLNAVLLLRMPLLSLAIPLWIVARTDAPSWLVSALFVLNTLGVMAFQVRTARTVTGLRSASRAVWHSCLIMLVSCLVLALSAAGIGPWGAGAVLVVGAVLLLMRRDAAVGRILADQLRPGAGPSSRSVPGLLRYGRPVGAHARPPAAHLAAGHLGGTGLARAGGAVPGDRARDGCGGALGGTRPGPAAWSGGRRGGGGAGDRSGVLSMDRHRREHTVRRGSGVLEFTGDDAHYKLSYTVE